MGKLMELTAAQKAAMAPHAETWIARGLDCTPADHATVEDGMARCYAAAGLTWHGRVRWVGSPLAVAEAGPVADVLHSDGIDPDMALDQAIAMVGNVTTERLRQTVRDGWSKYVGGQHWAYWSAFVSFFRDHCETDVPADIWDRSRAYEDANLAGWWWPHTDFVVVAERPLHVHREQVGPSGWGSHQLHSETGPAIAWPDGWAIWSWHGTRVPRWAVEAPTLDLIRAEANTEVRRCAIESYGWDRYLADLGVEPVSVEDDPGNPGHTLALYDLPEQLYAEPVRLLVMDNASLDRDGRLRRFAETVPASCRSAVEAAAWQFEVDPDVYRTLSRAT